MSEIFNLQDKNLWKDLALYQAGRFKRCPNCVLQRNEAVDDGDYKLKREGTVGNVDVWTCNSCDIVYLLENPENKTPERGI